MNKDEALDLALEALELTWDSGMPHPNIMQVGKAITAIKQARSAPPNMPYGWVRMNAGFNSGVFHLGTECPPGWVGGAVPVSKIAQPLAQPAVQREHITDGSRCWCNPDIDYIDPETGAAVIVHKEPQ
jgi:hypothetical protein